MRIEFELDTEQPRPVVKVGEFRGIIDTGAESSVCNLTCSVIPMIFIVRDSWEHMITGIGGPVKGKCFIVAELKVDKLTLKNVKIFAPEKPISSLKTNFILGMDIWSNLDCVYNTRDKSFVVDGLQGSIVDMKHSRKK